MTSGPSTCSCLLFFEGCSCLAGRKERGVGGEGVGEPGSTGHLPENEMSAGRKELIKGSGPCQPSFILRKSWVPDVSPSPPLLKGAARSQVWRSGCVYTGVCVCTGAWGGGGACNYLVPSSSESCLLIKGKYWLFPRHLFPERPRGKLGRI